MEHLRSPPGVAKRASRTEYAEVHYLTQQFVDRLCSSVAESDDLLDEIKPVVFLAHPPESRLGADSFTALVRLRNSETQAAVQSLSQRLDQLSRTADRTELVLTTAIYMGPPDIYR